MPLNDDFSMMPLSIIFAGAGAFGLPTLRAMMERGHEVVQVITQPDRPAGRGRKLTPTPIAQFTEAAGLSVLKTSDINNESLPAADLLVVIAFGQKISPHLVNHARLGSVNLHGSRLPKFRGAAPVNAAILSGERMTGNSIIRLAEKMDAGPVLAMSEIPIGELETAGELHDRLSADGAPLMLRVIEELAQGRAKESIQDESRATIAKKIRRDTATLDFAKSADEIARQILGLYPWPGCRVELMSVEGKRIAMLTLVRARAISEPTSQMAYGTIDQSGNVVTGDGTVQIPALKPDGGREMSLDDFRRGHAWSVGMRLQSVV